MTAGLVKLIAAGLICGGLLTLCSGGQREILRLSCACLTVILLLSLLQKAQLPSFDLTWGELQMQEQVEQAALHTRQQLLEQTARALEAQLKTQAAALDITCGVTVQCVADNAGNVTVERVTVDYQSGSRESLLHLQQAFATQLAVLPKQIIIQEDGDT